MVLGLTFAAVASAAFGVASVLQRAGAHGRRRAPFAIGVGLDGVGFVLTGLAARQLPLFLLEGVLATAVAVTAVVACVVNRERPRVGAAICVPAMVAGLVLLAFAIPANTAEIELPAGAFAAPAVVLAVLVLAVRHVGRAQLLGNVLAGLSGLAFGSWAVMSRFGSPGVVLVLAGVTVIGAGLVAFGSAVRHVTALAAMASCVAVETLVPGLIGLAAGDQPRPGVTGMATLSLGLGLTLASALTIGVSDGSRPRYAHAAQRWKHLRQ